MGLQAVIFDMDGVLCLTDEYHYQSWKAMADEYEIPFTRMDNEKLRGLTRRLSLEVILNGRRVSEEQVMEMMEKKNSVFLDLLEKKAAHALAEGAKSLLEEIRIAGLKIGVASASRNVKAVLLQLQIDAYIDDFCDGNDIQRSKPHPEAYLCTAERLKVKPGSCIAIEDSQAGIQAALQAGMCVIGLGPVRRTWQAHAVYKNLRNVRLRDLRKIYKLWQTRSKSNYQYLSRP